MLTSIKEEDNINEALIVHTPDVTEQQLEQIRSILKESQNPYESFKRTFKDELHVNYDRFLNTFYFAKKWR